MESSQILATLGSPKLPIVATLGSPKLPILATLAAQKLPISATLGCLKLPKLATYRHCQFWFYAIQNCLHLKPLFVVNWFPNMATFE